MTNTITHITINRPEGLKFMNANHRPHHHERARLTRQWRALGRTAGETLQAHTPTHYSRAKLTYTTTKTTRRCYDPPNLYPTYKAILDGLVDAGIFDDDHAGIITEHTFTAGNIGHIEQATITITPLPEQTP